MAKNEAPAPQSPPAEIASMRRQPAAPAAARHRNPLEPGAGTPWEDRGSIGFVPAIFKTAFAAMFAPRRLLDSMRRPETRADARVLAIAYGVFWGLGWVIHDLISFKLFSSSGPDFVIDYHGYAMVAHFALGIAGTYFVLQFASVLFHKLVSAGDAGSRIPPVLVYNVFAYCLGPSILALIPFGIGPLAALIWIFGLIVAGSVSRLGMKGGNAFVCAMIAFGGILGAAVLAYLGLRWAIGYLGLFAAPPPS
jgi:hypothetical protein